MLQKTWFYLSFVIWLVRITSGYSEKINLHLELRDIINTEAVRSILQEELDDLEGQVNRTGKKYKCKAMPKGW